MENETAIRLTPLPMMRPDYLMRNFLRGGPPMSERYNAAPVLLWEALLPYRDELVPLIDDLQATGNEDYLARFAETNPIAKRIITETAKRESYDFSNAQYSWAILALRQWHIGEYRAWFAAGEEE